MFKTHQTQGVDFLSQHGEGYLHWRMIERDLNNPWFHLTVSFEDRGETRVKSVFPNDVNLLTHLLSGAGNGIDVVCLQAVLPTHITGKSCWIMGPLEQLVSARRDDGQLFNIFYLENGEVYSDPALPGRLIRELTDTQTLYSTQSSLQA